MVATSGTLVNLSHLEGSVAITSAEDLRAALALRCGGTNEFWLWHDHEFPALLILVRGDLALVNYLPAEGDPGSIAVGDVQGLDPRGTTDLGGGPRSSERWCVANDQVVRAATAFALAEEFRSGAARPAGTGWIELSR